MLRYLGLHVPIWKGIISNLILTSLNSFLFTCSTIMVLVTRQVKLLSRIAEISFRSREGNLVATLHGYNYIKSLLSLKNNNNVNN